MSLKSFAFAAAISVFAASSSFAQEDHSAHQMPEAGSQAETEYRAAMDRMHASMSGMEYSGNADIDFARGMIPHHQAAIDMAKTVLAYGSDPEIKELAQAIVAAQESEIVQLEAWLAAQGAAPVK
ncbi:MAG: DUF305 domain-containing protein [Rhizobiaceae bacterium]|nr:DUF305 domain-containing protein [Rhizobiaceae bacterium]